MSIEEINEMVFKRDSLTDEEKESLSKAIVENEEARSIAIRGALAENNMQLATYLVLKGKQ